MVKKFFLVVFSLFCILSPYLVKADTLPNFDLNVSQYQYMDDPYYSDMTMREVIGYWTNLNSQYYNSVIFSQVTNPGDINDIYIYLVPKSVTSLDIDIRSLSGSNEFNIYLYANTDWKYYKQIDFYKNTSVSIDLTNKAYYENCYLNNVCTNGYYSTGTQNFYLYNSNSAYDPTATYNNMPYRGAYLLYSDIPINYVLGTNYTNKFSGLTINGTNYNGSLPSYFDIYGTTNYETYDTNDIYNILVGNITDLYSFRLNLQFEYDNYDIVNSMSSYFYVYGRKNNTTYYSYERIDTCSAINGHKLDKTLNNGVAVFEYFSQGISCGNTDLTQYDNFYIQLQTLPSANGLNNISNFGYYVTSGNFVVNDKGNYYIYDTFNDLPNDFSFLVTTNEPSSNITYVSDNKYVVGCGINLLNKNISQICSIPYSFGTSNNTGYMIFNMRQYDNNISKVSIYITDDSIVSFGTNGSNSGSSYDYYDNTGTIQTSNIDNNLTLNSTDEYNVDNYFSVVSSYIDDLSNDINEFSLVVQGFYDSAPVFMQTFMFVTFILLCTYFVYLIIRK